MELETIDAERTRPDAAPAPLRHPSGSDRARTESIERQLLAATRERPGASASDLAAATGATRSATIGRLYRLAQRGAIEKARSGHWRVKLEKSPRPTIASLG